MANELAAGNEKAEIMEQVIIKGDLSKLDPRERVQYYNAVCESVGLNPLTKPFDYIRFKDGGLQLYARKDATEQLRSIHGISITKIERRYDKESGILEVDAYAIDGDGRQDVDTGAVFIGKLNGLYLANARMKAVTKAKRRVTLSLAGLGWLDESEIDYVPDAEPVVVDHDTGKILESQQESPPESLSQDSEPPNSRIPPLADQLQRLFEAVNGRTDGYYSHVRHMHNVLKNEHEGFDGWPQEGITKAVAGEYIQTLVQYVADKEED